MVSAISTLVSKILILIAALTYAFSGLQQHINPHPILWWCEDKWDEESIRNLELCTFDGTNSTICFDENVMGFQKLRVCDPDESTLRIRILFALIFCNCLSLTASLQLNKIRNYVELFKATKTLLWFIPTNPVVHRNALFSLVSSDEKRDLETLREMVAVKDKETVINRPNRKGETALHLACKMNAL